MTHLCRVCLLKVEFCNAKNIFTKNDQNESICKMLTTLVPIKLSENDGLPKLICAICLQRLNDTFDFRNLILKSDLHLREIEKDTPSNTQESKTEVLVASDLVKVEDTFPSTEDPINFVNVEEVKETAEIMLHSKENDGPIKKPNRFSCAECKETFRSKYSLASHRFKHTGNIPFSCKVCNKRFPTNWSLRVHEKKHIATKTYECNICGKLFKFQSGLSTHLRIHQGIKPFKCVNCDKEFTQISSLQAHIATHTKDKRFVCEFCSNTFHTQSGLNSHIKTHTMSKVACPICGNLYAYKCLSTHMKRHSKEKPVSCEVCEKKFTEKSNLTIHMRIHNDVKPFTCDICGKSFRQRGVAKKHMRVHTGETPFPCFACDKAFRYKHHLKNHVQKAHGPSLEFCANSQLCK